MSKVRYTLFLSVFLTFYALMFPEGAAAESIVWGPKDVAIHAWRPAHKHFPVKVQDTQAPYRIRIEVKRAGRLFGLLRFNSEWHPFWGAQIEPGQPLEWAVQVNKKNHINIYVFSTKENTLTLSLVKTGAEARQTYLRGLVFDSEGSPLADVNVKVGNRRVTTDSKGLYAIPASTPGVYVVDIQKPGYTYAVRQVELLRGHDAAVAPAFLVPLDSKFTPVGPRGGKATNSAGDVEVVIPAGAVNGTVQVNLTPYRNDKTLPAPLPAASIFTHCVSLEPHGTVFRRPATLRVKNDLKFPPGTIIPNGSLNRETGAWIHESTGRVTDDGQWIEAKINGFSCRDINASGYFAEMQEREKAAKNATLAKDICSTKDKHEGSLITYHTGELEDWIDIPLVKSGGLGDSLRLNYFNTSAHPVGIVSITGRFEENSPEVVGYKLKVEGRYFEGFFKGSQDPYRLAMAVEGKDAEGRDLPSGLYPYEVELSNYGKITYGRGGAFGGVPEGDTGIETREMVPKEQYLFKGELRLFNRKGSPFGAGWGLSEEERLLEDKNSGNVLLMSGTGRSSLYRRLFSQEPTVSLLATTQSPCIGVFVDETGTVYYTDSWTGSVMRVQGGSVSQVAKLWSGATTGLYVRDGEIYVASTWGGIDRITSDGRVIKEAEGHDPCGVIVDSDRTIYYCETVNGRVYSKTPGRSGRVIAQGLSTPEFLFKRGSRLYVTERLGQKISLIDLTTGAVSTVADEAINAMTGETLRLLAPSGIFVDDDDTIFVADSGAQKIIKISADRSRYWVLAGTGGKGFTVRPVTGDVATFNFPEGIWKRGNEIFVADLFNKKIRKLTLAGTGAEGGEVRYSSPPGDYSTLVKKEDETFLRTLKDETKLFYDENGFLTRSLHLNGRSLTYLYDDRGQLTERVNDFGVKTTFGYDSKGKIEAIRDAAGRETRLELDARGDLLRVVRPDGAILEFTYDERHLLTHRTDERGYWKRYLYDALGMVAGTEDAMGVMETFTHSALLNLLPASQTPGDQRAPDPLPPLDQGNMVVDQKGREWLRKTDDRGYTTEFTDPLGRVTAYEIGCECGVASKITHPNGAVYEFIYDDEGRMLSSVDPFGAKTTFTYDSTTGKITSITSAKGYTGTLAYDGLGNLTSTTDPLGKTIAIAYNEISLPVRVTDALGNAVQIEYDPYGRPAKITDQLGYVKRFSYDEAGNLNAVSDALNQSVTYAYDPMGRVIGITHPRGYTTTVTYTAAGDVASVTDASGNVTTFSYDAQGRLIQEKDPLGKLKTFTYDENGNLLSATNRRGQIVQYIYDDMKRLSRRISPEKTIDFEYDVLDRLTKIGGVSLVYDLAGRLSAYTDASTGYHFSYDLLGNLEEVIDEVSGRSEHNSFDVLNRLREKWAGEEIFRFTYDEAGRRKSVSYEDVNRPLPRMKANSTYNARGELVDIAYENSIARFSYEYDPAGRRISLTDAYGKHDFSYDASGQLTAAKWKEMGLERFGYDGSGNMLYNREYDFHYGPSNRLLGDACGRLRFAYDDDGNMTEKETPDGVTRYQWDSEGRLTRVARPDGKVITYEYDDLGRKIRKKIGSSVWEWKYLGEDIVAENGPSGRKTYVHGPGIDEPLSMNGRKYFIVDGLGSVRKILGEEGEYRYTAFGKIIGDERGHLNAFAFTGREWDHDAALYYYRARWYDPQTGRFISEDPIGFAGGAILYIYSNNDPVRSTDPYGLWTVGIGIGGTAGAGAAASGSLMAVFDGHGNVGVAESAGGGGMGGIGFSGGGQIQITNADSIYDLRGLSSQTGFSFGVGPSAGAEYVIGPGYSGININAGFGGGLTPIELHGIVEYAGVQGTNIFDVLKRLREPATKDELALYCR